MSEAKWEKALVQSSFRGVPFWTESRDESGGHNLASHEWVDSDDVLTENTGRKHDGWSVDGYLWGDNCLDDKDKLLKALKQRGPGEYQDRWGKRHLVHAESWTFRETRKEGGWIALRIDFKEAGVDVAPTTTVDTAAAVDAQADETLPWLEQDFAAEFDTDGASWLAEDAASALTDIGQGMSELSAELASVGRPLVEYQRRASSLIGSVASLISAPFTLASRLRGMVSSLLGLAGGNPFSALKAALGLYRSHKSSGGGGSASYGSGLSGGGTRPYAGTSARTTSSVKAAGNRAALAAVVRRTALVEAARASSKVEYATYDDAVATRNTLTAALAEEVRSASNDRVKSSLRLLSAAVVRDINTRGADLTKLSTVTPSATLPALVVAHQVLGDATRASEILSRNPAIIDPLAVPGGQPIKVVAS